MQEHIDKTRRQLGELAVMSQQTEAAERKILTAAQARLDQLLAGQDKARTEALSGDDAAKQAYLDMTKEIGSLRHVIAHANQQLSAG